MQKSMSNFGHSVQKWPIMIAILMAFSVIPSPIWAGWCETNQGTRLFCNGVDWATSWGEGIGKYSQRRRTGKHRSTLQMPLLQNDAVLKSGKPVVYLGWTEETDSPYYSLTVEGENGTKTWEKITSTFLEIKKNQFQFEAGEYLVTVSTFVTDYSTGKQTPKAIEHKLIVNDQGCLNFPKTNDFNLLEQQLRQSEKDELTTKKKIVKAIWLAKQSSRCWLEAFQYIAGEQGLEDEKSALADGKVF